MHKLVTGLLTLLLCWAFHDTPVQAIEQTNGGLLLQNAVTGNGDGIVMFIGDFSSVGVQVKITGSATVTFQVTPSTDPNDTTNWSAKLCTLAVDGSSASSVTASGVYQCNTAGMKFFKAPTSGNSGTVTVFATASTAIFAGGSNGVAGWPVSATSKQITWANSLANAARIGDGVMPGCLYTDATLGFMARPCTNSNTLTLISSTFSWKLWDEAGALSMEEAKPSGANPAAMWSYLNAAYRPKQSISWNADAMHTDGAQCGQPTERILNSGAPMSTIICTNNASSSIYGQVEMPDKWDGGTITFMWDVVQTAADTAIMNSHIAAACRAQGDTINNTWGTLQTLNIAAVGGSNKKDRVTSAALTPNGTCTGASTLLQWRWQLDTSTTTAVATLHNIGVKMVYSIKSRSD